MVCHDLYSGSFEINVEDRRIEFLYGYFWCFFLSLIYMVLQTASLHMTGKECIADYR